MKHAAQAAGPALPEVKSIDDLFAAARTIEREAAARYDQLAALTGRHGNEPVAALFRKLAEEGREREARVARGAERLGRAAPAAGGFRWKVPQALDEEAISEAGGPYLLTPYRALCLAVENEKRALTFFVQVTSAASDEAVREQAEAMAKVALDHLVRLRLERRRAFRAEREASERAGQRPARPAAGSLGELLVCAREMEADAAARDAVMAQALEAAGADPQTTALLRQLAEEESRHAAALAARLAEAGPSAPPPGGAEAEARTPGPRPPGAPVDALRSALERAEEGFAFYSAVAKESTDETLLRQAQELAERMVGRLDRISKRLSALLPDSDAVE